VKRWTVSGVKLYNSDKPFPGPRKGYHERKEVTRWQTKGRKNVRTQPYKKSVVVAAFLSKSNRR
jgi:hypothetical protein